MTQQKLKCLRRSALAALITAALSQNMAYADLSVGSIFGQTEKGVTISVKNLQTGLKRELTSDNSGRFNFSQLPSGRYQVVANGVTREVNVAIGTGTPVNFSEEPTERISVVGSTISPIDTSSVESSTVFTAAQMERLPVGRDISDVALLAPGTVRGDSGFGKLASFGGSSVAENGYYINGFDVTNARTFLSYGRVPFDAIGEQEVKTGGFGAEYGRALGGVVNIVTKRGTNEWKFNGSTVWSPADLAASGRDVVSRSGEEGERSYYSAYRSADEQDELSYSLSGGGAIVQDKLFFYGLLEGKKDSFDSYSSDRSTAGENTSPNGLAKFDWYITDNHILEVTGIRNVEETDYTEYLNPDDSYFTGQHGNERVRYTERNGGEILIGKYTGHLTEDFTVGVLVGRLTNDSGYITPDPLAGDDCPLVDIYDQDTDDVIDVGCWNNIDVRSLEFGPDNDERKALRLDAEWRIGEHTLRFGYDDETFTSRIAGAEYSGGVFYRRYTPVDFEDSWNGVDIPADAHVVRKRTRTSPSGSYEVKNSALYLEDSFYVTDTVMLYAGIRSESFDNLNADGVSFVDASDMIAPRLGFVWDVDGDASSKLYANAGRYYIPIAANTNIRASNWQYVTTEYYLYDGVVDPTTQAPVQLGDKLGDTLTSGRNSSPDPATVASANLEPMLQDELILGYQRELSDLWTGGVSFIYREVKNGVDDYCGRQAFIDFAEDQGFEDFDPDSLATCMILNPGEDLEMDMDVAGDGVLQRVTVPNSYLQLADYKRTYKALEFNFERASDNGWYMQGSYVWAKSQGNSEGLVNSWLESESPGLTNDFDHKVFVDGTDGYLSNDRRHTFKLFGGYELNEEMEVSANLLVQSGRPVSCFGYAPFDVDEDEYEVFERYAASSLYCRNVDGEQELTQRGQFGRTPWTYTVDLGFSYRPQWVKGLLLQANVFNVLNSQRVTEYDEKGDLSLEDEGQNPNFLNDQNYQSPRSVRLTARYSF
ncbi:carboxypeptidase regulatory-like domain-containing protein [Rheinheimera sp. MM224]|uniref:TonB-dependent receptor n=1 Tax=Rheinheimera sp. MM224 TaxID=3019969 RepID=UPI0021F91AB3|nr:carboxypeptidase regulatory-like domain-containing protein [Rheinheimera sp. MM224]CAI3804971.1 hypothetical protein JAMGFMIE_03753 [Rheinheimera sp. MM224]